MLSIKCSRLMDNLEHRRKSRTILETGSTVHTKCKGQLKVFSCSVVKLDNRFLVNSLISDVLVSCVSGSEVWHPICKQAAKAEKKLKVKQSWGEVRNRILAIMIAVPTLLMSWKSYLTKQV